MADETLYGDIASRIPAIYVGALLYAEEMFAMPQIVRNFANSTNMEVRNVHEYAKGTVVNDLGETDDIDNQQFADTSLSSLTPQEHGTKFTVSDRRLEGDPQDVMADLTRHIGYTMFADVERNLTSTFSSFTGGTVYTGAGTAAGTLTWAKVYAARAILAAKSVPRPYNLVVHEYQWNNMATELNIVNANAGPSMRIRDDIQNNHYLGSVGDMNVYVVGDDGLTVPAGGTIYAGLFQNDAIAFDVRRPLRIEAQRDASLRATEIVVSMIYAYGVWRKNWGVAIKALAEAPS